MNGYHRFSWVDRVKPACKLMHPDNFTSMSEKEFATLVAADARLVFLDTETSGLSGKDRVIEVAAVEVKNLSTFRADDETLSAFWSRFNPGCPINPGSQQIHGLSNEYLRRHPDFRARVDELLAFIGGSVIVAHNAPFDMRFLAMEFAHASVSNEPKERARLETFLRSRFFDSAKLAKLLPEFKLRAGLDNMVSAVGLTPRKDGAVHTALDDTLLLASMVQRVVSQATLQRKLL